MDRLPPEIEDRLARLSGARVSLLYEGVDRLRAVVIFETSNEPPLTLTLDGVRDAAWGFANPPVLRVPWRYSGAVRAVRLATVRSFGSGAVAAPGTAIVGAPAVTVHVRVEVDIEGSPTLCLEGLGLMLGPVAPPMPPSVPSAPGSIDLGHGSSGGLLN